MAQEWREIILKEDIVLPSGKIITLGRARTHKDKRLYIDGKPTYRFMYDGQVGPVHYKDAGGAWQDIHTELVPSTRSIVGFGNPAFEMTENEYEMFILGALSSGIPVVRYVSKNTDYWVQFAAHNLQWTNDLDQISSIATPPTIATQISGSEARWPNAYGAGRNLRYIAGAGRMQKWLDIASLLPAPPQFIIDGGNPVIELAEILEFHPDLEVWVNGAKWNKKDDVGAATEVEFRSPDRQVQFVFPVATGYHEGLEDSSVVGKLHLKKSGAKLYVTARFPLSWLQSAIYPIHLDTTVDKQVAASADDCYRRLVPSAWSLIQTSFQAGDYLASDYDRSGGARFLGINITQGATIDLAYMSIKAESLYGTIPTTYIEGEDVDDAATFSSSGDYDGRTRTTASVAWTPAEWLGDTWYNSEEIKTVIKEIVDRPGWVSGNDLVLFWRDAAGWGGAQKLVVGYSWDAGFHLSGPKLHIEYTAGGAAYSIVAGAGSYVLAGTATSLLADRVIGAGAGSYALTGAAVSLLKDMLISAGAGSYTLTGQDVGLLADRVITADSGIYILTGATVNLIRGLVLAAEAGSYTLTGSDVALLRDLIMAAAGGAYALIGSDVAFLYGKVMAAASGSYAITGSQAGLLADLVIQALAGSYAVTGKAASLLPSGVPFAPPPKCIVQWKHDWEISESGRDEDG